MMMDAEVTQLHVVDHTSFYGQEQYNMYSTAVHVVLARLAHLRRDMRKATVTLRMM